MKPGRYVIQIYCDTRIVQEIDAARGDYQSRSNFCLLALVRELARSPRPIAQQVVERIVRVREEARPQAVDSDASATDAFDPPRVFPIGYKPGEV